MKPKMIASATVLLIGMSAAAVSAQGISRVDRIMETGAISLGHPEASIPFAFLDEDEKPVGYSVEICEEVAKIIGEKLSVENLEIRYTPTTSSTRLPLIQNGTIDLECGNTTNKIERKKMVAFAPTTFVSQIVLAARADSGLDVNDLASFKGKVISATAGGQTFKVTAELSAKNSYEITMAGAPDTSRAFLLLETGRADGMVSDDGLLYAAVATSKAPDDYVIGSKGLEFAPYAIVQPKDDPKFKELVDGAVRELMENGRVSQLYEKYFNSPIPPKGINLGYPMSDALERAIANPTDSSQPSDYQ